MHIASAIYLAAKVKIIEHDRVAQEHVRRQQAFYVLIYGAKGLTPYKKRRHERCFVRAGRPVTQLDLE